jgi:NAD(P)-dependent dehydrogenase (short-subunit alcohol dehydrogenase family)
MPCNNAPLTEGNLPNQTGKVFIVTGGSAGLGKLLVRILFQRHAKVYIAARSESKTQKVIEEIVAEFPASKGSLTYLHLDLDDLTSIKASADTFLAQESRLDVLWNNAGVMCPPEGSVTKQGYEQQLGVNTLAPFLFTLLLRDVLVKTAQQAPVNSVRVAWVSSIASTMRPAIDFENLDNLQKSTSQDTKYAKSKSGTCVHAVEFQRRVVSEGVVSVVCFCHSERAWWVAPADTFAGNRTWYPYYGTATEPLWTAKVDGCECNSHLI